MKRGLGFRKNSNFDPFELPDLSPEREMGGDGGVGKESNLSKLEKQSQKQGMFITSFKKSSKEEQKKKFESGFMRFRSSHVLETGVS